MAEEEDHRVTLGEVWRGQQAGFERLDKRLSDISRDMVGRAEYESDQEATAARFSRVDDTVKEWRDTSTAEHVQIRAELKAVKVDAKGDVSSLRERMDKAEERGKNQRWAVILAIIVGAVGLVTGVIGAVVQGAIGP